MYMATCRGQATRLARVVETSSSVLRPKCSQAADWISAYRRPRVRRGRLGVEGVEYPGHEVGRERSTGERREGHHANEGAFERAHVERDALGDDLQRVGVGERDPVVVNALAQDGQAGGEVGRADVGDETGLEALAQAVLERGEVAGGGGRKVTTS